MHSIKNEREYGHIASLLIIQDKTMKTLSDSYIFKKEVDWSLLTQGFAIKHEHQIAFGQIAERYVAKGESKPIKIIINGKTFDARLENVNFNK